ncbi:CPBP family intramembrane glutamic endopeptidase [Peptoniphilus catoniae]|uniref:CPBP family intramembrane glutamic endopeptidase n=1 Tax=Peptoniphilus catoniae TaxID=1660341 RepID=UPI0010FF5358|nr:CPBP family intramembrane glutamic endopeptidase [Peptoniphilus catoniae]
MTEKLINNKDYTDFPFEDLPGSKWIISMILLFGGFLVSSFNFINPFLSFAIFIGSSFGSLFVLNRRWYRYLIKSIEARDILVIIFVLILTYAFAFLSSSFIDGANMEENPIVDLLEKDTIKLLALIVIIQLFTEEILFVVPFLFCYHKLKGLNKGVALIIAWLVSSIIFGALHLPTYNYNLEQSLIVISSIRFALSLAYILRKNLLVSYIIHLLYDGIIFVFVFLAKLYGYY